MRAIVPDNHALTADLPESLALFFSQSSAFEITKQGDSKVAEDNDERKIQSLLRYAPTRLLLSGWIKSPEVIQGKDSWLRAEHGRGKFHLFGFRPEYRALTQATFPLIFRAALFDNAE